MFNVTAAQLDLWIASVMFPAARILGLIAAAPLFNNRVIPARIRLSVGLVVTVAVIPALPPMPEIPVQSWHALLVLAQQALIGIAIGFMMRLFFAIVDLAGEMIGLQMGLSFALFFNPQTGGQSSVVAEFLGLLNLVIFLALNGHLMLLEIIATSFEWLPIGGAMPQSSAWALVVRYATVMYTLGVLLALPMVAALLITNIALGVLTRAAPQLNLFAVGFPVTLSMGFCVLLFSLSLFAPMAQRIFERAFAAINELMRVMM